MQASEQNTPNPGLPLETHFAPGQMRRRCSGNFLPSSADGIDVTLQVTLSSRQPPARRYRCLLLSCLRPLMSRAYNNRHRIDRYRWHSELLQAPNRRPKSSCPTQRSSPFHLLDLGAHAIPPRTRRHRRLRRHQYRRLRRPRRRHLHPHPRHPRTNRPSFRTLPGCGALHVRLGLTSQQQRHGWPRGEEK